MATYDYGCTQCAHVFETTHSMTESPVIPCPQCGGITEKKISRGAGLMFKGTGFYVTDYASGKASSAGNSDSATSASSPPADASGGSSCALHQH